VNTNINATTNMPKNYIISCAKVSPEQPSVNDLYISGGSPF